MNFFAIRNYSIAALIIASTASFSSSTVAQNKISCQSTFGLSIRCVVNGEELKKVYKFREEAFETEYNVKYFFSCPGDSVGFGFALKAPSSNQPSGVVSLYSSNRAQEKIIPGVGDLYLHDPDPSRTRNSSFRGECQLTVDDVTRQPTSYTERLWDRRIRDKEEVVSALDSAIRLTVNLDQYDVWSRSQRRLLEDQISELIEEYQFFCDSEPFSDSCFTAEDLDHLLDTLQAVGPDAVGQDERALLNNEFTRKLSSTEDYLRDFQLFIDRAHGENL